MVRCGALAGTGYASVNNFGRNLALWVIIALLLVVLFNLFQPSTSRDAATQVAYSDFLGEVNGGHVRDVVIQGRNVSYNLTDGRSFRTYTPEDPALVSRLTDKGVRVIAKPEDSDVNPLVQGNVRLQGSFSHNYGVWERVIHLLTHGLTMPETIIGLRAPLEGWREAFDAMHDRRVIKSVLIPAHD